MNHTHRIKLKLKNAGPCPIKLGVNECVLRIAEIQEGGKAFHAVAITDGPHPNFSIRVSRLFASEDEARRHTGEGFEYDCLDTYGHDTISVFEALKQCPNVEVLTGPPVMPEGDNVNT